LGKKQQNELQLAKNHRHADIKEEAQGTKRNKNIPELQASGTS
jgi:hypothetical protein